MGMTDERVAELTLMIESLDDRELKKAAWWMPRAEQLLPLVDAELKKRGI